MQNQMRESFQILRQNFWTDVPRIIQKILGIYILAKYQSEIPFKLEISPFGGFEAH